MEFSHRERTGYRPSLVFRTHRDELSAVVAHLDAVRRVELISRTEHATGRLELLHRWLGTKAALPLIARPFVPEEVLVWLQRTTWDESTLSAAWQIEVPGFGESIDCRGTNRYHETPGGSRIDIAGTFVFQPDRVEEMAGVPSSTVPIVERMVVSLVVPLIERSGAAVARYLEHTGAPKAEP